MNLIERVKNILTTPKTEWLAIEKESASPKFLLVNYVLPMAILSSLGALLKGLIWAGTWGLSFYLVTMCISFISIIISFYLTAYVVDMLAPSFNSEKNINKSAQLVAYSNTPSWIAGFLSFVPYIGLLIIIAGWIYSMYLMYLGVGPLKKTPEDKKIIYIILSYIIMLVIGFIIGAILGSVFYGTTGYGYGWGRTGY